MKTGTKIISLLLSVVMLGVFATTAFAADADGAAVTVIEGYGPDSDDSEFGTVSGNEIISDTYNGTSWIDYNGSGNLYFQWGYGDSLDVTLINRDGVVSYESVIIQEHSDPEKRDDAHWMEFPLSGVYTDDTYIVATHGFDEYIHNEDLARGTGSVANVFTQTASGDPSFLSDDMLMYGEDYITDGSASLLFESITATFRFVITNTHGKALSLESVTLRVVDADGNSVPVASQHCMIETYASIGYPELTYSDETYDSITTNLSGYTLEAGESYLAYALALPLQSDDALTDKTIQIEVTTSEGKCIAFELAADALSNANLNNEYNWLGEKSYTFRMGTRCESACTLDAAGKCSICGYQCDHDYDNGFCTVCEAYQPATLVTNENYASLGLNAEYVDYYAISNAGQLFWFANHVNTVDRTASAVLTADIDLENRPWTPIGVMGEDSNSFHGVFDGKNYTIRGLNVTATSNGAGFFGEVRTGTVKNFTIYGEVVVNTEVDYVGGVIGSICGLDGENDLYRNGAEIQNITSYVNVTAKAHGIGKIGGFVGYANHESLIENCSWYGTFDAGVYRVDDGAGGFIGHIYTNSSVTIRNCAAYGTIKTNYAGDYNNTATIYMGGFLSFSNTNAKTTLEHCLFAGRFERGENLTDQAFLGAFGTLRSVNAIKNCYYLGDDGLAAVHSDSLLKPGSDNVEITSVTKAQLLSGEVAHKLGEHFGQILEGENRQSYPVLGETKVEDSQRFEIYGQQLNIGADLSMKYYVMGYAPAFNSGALYMEFSHNGVKTKVYAGEPNADGFYVFILEGINPQCMGDSIRAMLYYNETEVASHGCEDGKEYSVEKNLLNLLEKYKDDAALVALINDTLAYGKAASEYKKHDTMTGDYTVSDRTIPDATVTPNGAFTGYTVVFGQANFIKVSVELADGYALYLDGTDITTQLVGGIFKTDGIAPTEFDKKFSFEIKNGDTVVQTFAVSVNDYIGAQKNSATMGNLAKALYNYGVSAEVYNHVKTGEGEHYYVDNVCVCGKLGTIDATAMTADELKAAVADQLAAGKTNIFVVLATDAEQEMFSAIWNAFSESTAADGSINLTISGAKTVPDYGFFDIDNYHDNGDKNIAGDKLKSLTLTDVETIGDFAFSACTYLESVNLPQVVTIGECAFNQYTKGTKLTSLDLPNATTIGDWAFAYSSLLTSVNLPKVVTIGEIAFAGCDLRSLYLPEATTIGGEAFMNNDNLVSCSAPKATTIDYYPWGSNGTSKLERLELTAVGDFTLGNNLFAYTPTEQIDLVLNKDKETQVTQNEDGTATWKTTNSNGGKLEYTFKSITFVGE